MAAVALLASALSAQVGQAQFFRGGAVGGVKVDVDGVLSNPEVSELKELRQAWQAGLQEVPDDLQKPTDLRFVSLKRLEAEAARAQQEGKPLPDAVRFMAGLSACKYVLVYPEQHDIVLAGPAEGWRVDALGNVVGAASGQPVLLLDDLMVALRAAEQSNMTGISCSIDPTPEGMQRLQQISGSLSANNGARNAAEQMEEARRPAADHRDRRAGDEPFRPRAGGGRLPHEAAGMDFEPAPVDGMPSFLDMFTRPDGGPAEHDAALVARAELRADPPRRGRPGLGAARHGREVPDRAGHDGRRRRTAAHGQEPTRSPKSGPTRSPRSSTNSRARIRPSASSAT